MTIRSVIRLGHPKLRERAEVVRDFSSTEIKQCIQDLLDTMDDLNAQGLAAPQIGISQQIIAFRKFETPLAQNQKIIIINPNFEIKNPRKIQGWEYCYCVPGMKGLVERYASVTAKGYNEHGEVLTFNLENGEARVFQHECDHLLGTLYLDKLVDMSYFGFTEEINHVL